MKKIIVLALVLTVGVAEAYWNIGVKKTEYQCHICGKSIYKNEPITSNTYGDISYGGNFGGFHIPTEEQANEIIIENNIKVCPLCWKNYNKKLKVKMRNEWNKNIKLFRKKNKYRRAEQKEIRNDRQKKEINKKIKELKKEIKKLEEEKQ